MNDSEPLVLLSVFVVIAICGLVGVWNNWVWIGKDGYNLPYNLRPGFFKFWFSVMPRWLMRLKTGMEDVTL